MKNDYSRPLEEGETDEKTIGCRLSNPNICAKNRMPNVCAFATKEGICYEPPTSWKKLYKKLREGKDE